MVQVQFFWNDGSSWGGWRKAYKRSLLLQRKIIIMHDITYNIIEKILHLYMKNSVKKCYRNINALFPKKEIIQKYNIKYLYLSGGSSCESSAFVATHNACFNVYNLQISTLKHNFTYSFLVSEDKHNDIKNIEILWILYKILSHETWVR